MYALLGFVAIVAQVVVLGVFLGIALLIGRAILSMVGL